MTLPGGGLTPFRELVRRVEGLSGSVRLRWCLEPRFGYASARTRIERRDGVPVASSGSDALALHTWDAGDSVFDDQAVTGGYETEEGRKSLLVLTAAHQEPLVLPRRDDSEGRLEATARFWREWARGRE